MKMNIILAVSLSVLAHGAVISTRSFGTTFGPKGCVSITRSSAGSCVLTTDCESADVAHTEFAFNCIGSGEVVRHSFGTGGFENEEEFDTEIKCDICEKADESLKFEETPAPAKIQAPSHVAGTVVFHAGKATHHAKAKVAAKANVATKAAAGAKAQSNFWPFTGAENPLENKEPEATKYGPNGCVSTWRNAEGHCIMQTNCKKADLGKYDFGLVCVDKVGAPVKHLFGKDAFDAVETFDTLIKCDKCLGLEDIPDDVALNGQVAAMSKDIGNLVDVMKNISTNVKMLNEEVFKSAPAAAPAPGPASAEAPAAAVSLSVHERLVSAADAFREEKHAKRNLRHAQKHVAQAEDEDTEEGDNEERDDDGSEGSEGSEERDSEDRED